MAKDEEAGVSNGPSQSHSSLPPAKKIQLHPAFFVAYDPNAAQGLILAYGSSSVVLSSCSINGFSILLGFVSYLRYLLLILGFPIFLTTWHLVFATVMTQILARTTHLLDGLKTVKMDGRTYIRAILPVGVFFSLSLICSNQAYLYLSVAFIQMLKVRKLNCKLILGDDARCSSRHNLGHENGTSQPESSRERFVYCRRNHRCFIRGNCICIHRVCLPSVHDHLREYPTLYGSKTIILTRIQDGSPCVSILLCPCLCDHEWDLLYHI